MGFVVLVASSSSSSSSLPSFSFTLACNGPMSPSEASGDSSCSVIGCAAASSPPMSSCRNPRGRHRSCLAKLVTTLNKCRKMVASKGRNGNSRQATFRCRYDPLSYALNFDSGGRGGNYDDYYRFCAFTNRFLVRPTTTATTTTPVLAVSH